MTKRVVWSLFDGSGIMGLPWAERGATVYCFNADSGDHGEYKIRMEHPNIHYVDMWIDDYFPMNVAALDIPNPDIIFAFPSCTDLAHSGAKHARADDALSVSVDNAKMIETLGVHFNCPWMVENPVGKLSTLWRKPNFYFHPCEFGGYMLEHEEVWHPKMPRQDAYNKKTCIWCGNGFNEPERKPVESIGFFWAWKFLGGKSERTKMLRSITPRGFARAVQKANWD